MKESLLTFKKIIFRLKDYSMVLLMIIMVVLIRECIIWFGFKAK